MANTRLFLDMRRVKEGEPSALKVVASAEPCLHGLCRVASEEAVRQLGTTAPKTVVLSNYTMRQLLLGWIVTISRPDD